MGSFVSAGEPGQFPLIQKYNSFRLSLAHSIHGPGTGLLQSLTTDKLVGRHGPESLNGVPFARPSVEENGVEVESSCQ